MSYANDQLYNGYLRKNMGIIVSKETIEAKREISGNFNAMTLLLDCLKRRENWPEQFIAALEACEHWTMAAEIRAEYDALRGINNNPHPPTPPATSVVTAHVHPAPAQHRPDPGTAACAQPAQDVPSERVIPQGPPVQETASITPAKPPASVVVMTIPLDTRQPQVEAQPEAMVVPPVTPPPSPEKPRGSASPSPPPEPVEFITHQEPEENVEPEHQVQNVPDGTVMIQHEAEESSEVPAATDPSEPKEEPCEVGESLQPNTIVDQHTPAIAILDQPNPIPNAVKSVVGDPEPSTTFVEAPTHSTTVHNEAALKTFFVDNPIPTTAVVEEPPRSPSPPLTNLDDRILTPEKPPVQETNPPVDKVPAVVTELEETSEPPDTQVVVNVQYVEVASSPPTAVENDNALSNKENISDEGSLSKESDICFSKPGVLVSVNLGNTTIFPLSPELGPYSGNSGRLQMSEAERSSCQEKGIDHNKPEEIISESPAPSLEVEDVRENSGHVVENPSMLNQEIQTPLLRVNEDTAKEITPSPGTSLIFSTSSSPYVEGIVESPAPSLDMEDVRQNVVHVAEQPPVLNQEVQMPLLLLNGERAIEVAPILPTSITAFISDPSSNNNHQQTEAPTIPILPDPGKKTKRLNAKYILTAAGVGACALLIAWRFKH